MRRPGVAEAHAAAFLLRPVFYHHAADQNPRKQGRGNTQHQYDGKTFDRAQTEYRQGDTYDKGGQVAVDDGASGVFKTSLNGITKSQSCSQFFPNALVNDYVGVNGHTDGQYDTGDTGQSQYSTQGSHGTQQQEDVDDQRQDGYDTTTGIIGDHKSQNGKEGNDQSTKTFVDVLSTEGWSDYRFLDDAGFGG